MEIKEEIVENGYKCDICDKNFSRKVQFNKHKLQHASIVELDNCSDSETKPRKRGRRRKKKISKFVKHTHLDPVECDASGKKLKKLSNKYYSYKKKSYRCKVCKIIFAGKSEYARHVCLTVEKKPFSCSRCNAQFSWRDQLSYHSCDADQASQSQESESEHEAQSVSDILSSAVVDNYQLPIDETSKEELYKIDFDEHKLSDFSEHKELSSNHQVPVTCEVCWKVFPYRTAYYRHACTKIQETPYSCLKCKAQFFRQEELEGHDCSQNHDNQTQVSANEQSHPTLSSMNVDILLASNDDGVVCGLCQRPFAQKGHLILHYRRHHKRELIAIEV